MIFVFVSSISLFFFSRFRIAFVFDSCWIHTHTSRTVSLLISWRIHSYIHSLTDILNQSVSLLIARFQLIRLNTQIHRTGFCFCLRSRKLATVIVCCVYTQQRNTKCVHIYLFMCVFKVHKYKYTVCRITYPTIEPTTTWESPLKICLWKTNSYVTWSCRQQHWLQQNHHIRHMDGHFVVAAPAH